MCEKVLLRFVGLSPQVEDTTLTIISEGDFAKNHRHLSQQAITEWATHLVGRVYKDNRFKWTLQSYTEFKDIPVIDEYDNVIYTHIRK